MWQAVWQAVAVVRVSGGCAVVDVSG